MNVAARLQELALANEIIVSETVYNEIGPSLQVENRGPKQLYGRRDKVTIFNLTGLSGI